MNNRFYIGLMAMMVLVLGACAGDDTPERIYPTEYHSLQYLIETDELQQLLETDSTIVLIDTRPAEKYLAGHIPGAVNAWRPALRDHSLPYSGMIASRAQTEALFDSLGINPTDKIVLYDDRGGCDAARLWWMLLVYGYQNNAILNGGSIKWEAAGNSLDTGQTKRAPSNFKFAAVGDPSLHAGYWDVEEAIQDSNTLIIDTRSLDEFSGERQKKGAFRAGHIPTAILFDWGNSVHLDKDHVLKSPKDLLYMLDSLGITTDKNIITYCHSGVRSAHTTFVLKELLGFPNVRNYDGSWTEWSYMEELPIEADVATPTILK